MERSWARGTGTIPLVGSAVTGAFAFPNVSESVPNVTLPSDLIGSDGHFTETIDLSCDNDDAANEKAKQLIDAHDVELWQQARVVAVLKCHPK